MTEIDLMERKYMEEYDKIINFDREEGKDFNHLALADLKRAQYYFEYLRKSQKLWKEKCDEPSENIDKKEVKEFKETTTGSRVSLNVEEKDLFKSDSQNRAEAVLGAARFAPEGEKGRQGKRYDMFKEEFKDIFEEQIDSRK